VVHFVEIRIEQDVDAVEDVADIIGHSGALTIAFGSSMVGFD